MSSVSKLTLHYNAENEADNLVIIPSGYILGKGSDTTIQEQLELLKVIRLSKDDPKKIRASLVSITLPHDKNIYEGNFSENEFSHSPEERAEMIYEAVTAKNADGSYKYNNIFFTGGSNTEDVILELDKLCKEKGALPQRKDNLKTYGFSDASQLHHYLGQRGISSPVYYSKGVPSLIVELDKKAPVSTEFELSAVNEKAEHIDNSDGWLQPGNLVQVEDKMTHQTALFDDPEKYNFMVLECRSKNDAKAFLEASERIKDKKIALLLSKDSVKDAVDLLKKEADFPIFMGMPVGHGEQKYKGQRIVLFSGATLTKTENGYILKTSDKADDKVKDLDIKNRRAPFKIKGGKDTTAELSFINGSAGAVFKNLNELQVASSSVSIKIPKEEADNIIQTMELSVKKLYEKRIITPETIKNINFECDGVNVDGKMLECMKRRMKDLQKRYFPDLKEIKLNDKQIISAEQKRGKSLQSAITQAQSSSKKDNPYMFKLCQEKQQRR